ncbi:hypothetical protein V493_07245 [Pseudogymnoascus sp. VKM F-4281 (FW-2241)]|nr:hypothetical protein V493_07245 [Pseudogymnoascus sp. VKM F-4281 (FW-2241)]
MARRENGEAQPSNAQEHASKPKEKKAGKLSATLNMYLYGSASVQERMAYQSVDKKYWEASKVSSKVEIERLEKIIKGV